MENKKKSQKKPPETNEVNFTYRYPDDYRPLYSNAIWGGLNVKGEIEIHFLYDRRPLPNQTTHEIKNGILQGHPKKAQIDETTLRFIQTGVVMSRDTAKSLYEWLGDKLKLYKELSDGKK